MSDLVKAIATSSGTGGGTCTADVAGVTTTIEICRGITVASGDALLVGKYGTGRAQWAVIGLLAAAAPAAPDVTPVAPPTPKPTTITGKLVCVPVETRSRQGSKWRTDNTDIYQGEYGGNGNHVGCAFYGTKPRSLAGATVTSATIKVKRQNGGGITAAQPTTLRLVTERTRPSGAPTLGSSTSGPSLRWGASSTFTIPTSWAQAMVDGTAGGLAFYEAEGSPYLIYEGRGDYAASFTLTISWTRTP